MIVCSAGYGAERDAVPQRSHLSVFVNGGRGAFTINNNLLEPTNYGSSFGAEVGYTYLFTSWFGLHIGTELNNTFSGIKADIAENEHRGMADVYGYLGWREEEVIFVGRRNDVVENYSSLSVAMPLQLHFNANNFMFDIGAKLLYNISCNIDYDYGAGEYGMRPIIAGSGSYGGQLMSAHILEATSGSYSMASHPLMVLLSVDMGYAFKFNSQSSLQLGLYADYSVMNHSTNNKELFVSHASEVCYSQSTMLNSLGYFSAGVRIGYTFGFNNSTIRKKNKEQRLAQSASKANSKKEKKEKKKKEKKNKEEATPKATPESTPSGVNPSKGYIYGGMGGIGAGVTTKSATNKAEEQKPATTPETQPAKTTTPKTQPAKSNTPKTTTPKAQPAKPKTASTHKPATATPAAKPKQNNDTQKNTSSPKITDSHSIFPYL